MAWRKVLGYRWPLAAATFVLVVYGGVMNWMLFLANSARTEDAARLERGPRVALTAVVTAAEPAATADAPARQRVDYTFSADGQQWTGRGVAPRASYADHHPIRVEYLAGEPRLNRIVDAPVDTRAPWFDPGDAFALLLVPGLLLGLGYLAGVFHLRRVLAHGDVGIAAVASVRRVRWCLPDTLAVRFQFRDHRAQERTGRHWVRAHSALGERLTVMQHTGAFDRVPVLHDRRFPQHCRLVLPEDFAPDRHPVDPAATIRL